MDVLDLLKSSSLRHIFCYTTDGFNKILNSSPVLLKTNKSFGLLLWGSVQIFK